MKTNEDKYFQLISLLKNSNPGFERKDEVVSNVMRQLQREKSHLGIMDLIKEFFFGWVYIGWLRNSMIAASVILMLFFTFQQTILLKRINELTSQKIQDNSYVQSDLKTEFLIKSRFFSLSPKNFPDKTHADVDRMIHSVKQLRLEYNELFKLIEKDSVLRKYVEEKLQEENPELLNHNSEVKSFEN